MCLRLRPRWLGLGPHHAVHFGRDDDLIAHGHLFQMRAGDLLAEADGVHVGGIEEIDAGVERDAEVLARIFFIDVPALGAQRPIRQIAAAVAHASQAEAGHGDSSISEVGVLHRL